MNDSHPCITIIEDLNKTQNTISKKTQNIKELKLKSLLAFVKILKRNCSTIIFS